MLEPPRRGGSNEYPQSMFWSKNKKNRYTPANPFYYIKVGFKGVFIARICFPDVWLAEKIDHIKLINACKNSMETIIIVSKIAVTVVTQCAQCTLKLYKYE